jgi:transcriptional regulator with XRE-family HTH domain
MTEAGTPFTRELEQLMLQKGLNRKSLSLLAGLGETYVRDLMVGRSGGPQAKKLTKLARVLGVSTAYLLDLAGAPPAAQIVKEADELVLLEAWRELAERDQEMVLDFIRFRVAAAKGGRGEAV